MTTTGKTKLAELAGANRLSGAVCVTDAGGITHRYASEAEAEAEWGTAAAQGRLEHARGAFRETPAPALRDAPSGKRRKGSSYGEESA